MSQISILFVIGTLNILNVIDHDQKNNFDLDYHESTIQIDVDFAQEYFDHHPGQVLVP